MNRKPLLIASVLLLAFTASVVVLWIGYESIPVRQENVYLPEAPTPTPSLVPLALLGAALFGLILWLWALIHLLTNPALAGTDKIVWTIVIVFLNVLGAILYFAIRPRPAASPPGPAGVDL